MDISAYFKPLLKWWWLLILACLVAVTSSFLVTRRQAPIYQTRTTMIIGRAVYESNPTGNEFNLNQQLANFYADLVTREPIRNAVLESLGLTQLPEFVAQVRPNSSIIEISVTDTDPVRAQAVANTLADKLINTTPTNDSENEDRQQFINDQLNQLEMKITETQDEISRKQAEIADVASAREIGQLENEILSLELKLSTLSSNYSSLLSNTKQGAVNTITIIERASLPRLPIGPNNTMIILLSGVIALAIAAAAAYLLEYLDDTLKSTEEVQHFLNLPVIGQIAEIEKSKEPGVYVTKQPRSAVAESYRSLRTDLEFSGVDRPLKTILVTSPGVAAGKTTTAINLATVMAQSGKKVILVDADLRKPSIHQYLGIPNQKGLSDVFRGNLDVYNATVNWKDGGFFVITSGILPPNPAELLGSKKMDQILDHLERAADIVIMDGPPFLVTDASILASKVDGVLLVLRHGFSRRPEAITALNQLKRLEARVLGAVMNRIPRSAEGYFNAYRHYYRAYYGDDQAAVQTNDGNRSLSGLLKRKKEPKSE